MNFGSLVWCLVYTLMLCMLIIGQKTVWLAVQPTSMLTYAVVQYIYNKIVTFTKIRMVMCL